MKKAVIKFEIKSANPTKAVTIEGFANKAIIDRAGDIIPPSAWQLEEFNKNNIMLFNHNQDFPIGTAEVKVTDEGLVAKGKISRSNEAPIPYIRDMIKEGILQTFSVGFDPKGSEEKQENGSFQINQASLLELSVVSVPMNQESTFSVDQKAIDQCASTWKTKSYHSARADVLHLKGAYLAGIIHDRIAQLQMKGGEFDRDRSLQRIAEQAQITSQEINEILVGDSKAITDTVLDAFAQEFGLDKETLGLLNKRNDREKSGDSEEAKKEEESGQDKEVDQESADTKADGDNEEKSEEPAVKEMDDKEEEEEKEEEEKEKMSPLEELVTANVPMLLSDGLEMDQAIAVAISMAQKSLKTDDGVSVREYLNIFTAVEELSKTKNEVVSQNLDQSNETIENANTSNPAMDQFKAQTTILASIDGAIKELILEMRGMRGDFQTEKAAKLEPTPEPAPEVPQPTTTLDQRALRVKQFENKLQKLEKYME